MCYAKYEVGCLLHFGMDSYSYYRDAYIIYMSDNIELLQPVFWSDWTRGFCRSLPSISAFKRFQYNGACLLAAIAVALYWNSVIYQTTNTRSGTRI